LSPEVEDRLEREDPHWPAQLAILAALVLHIALPGRVTVIPDWIVPVAEGLLLAALVIAHRRESPRRRAVAFAVIGLVIAANTVTLGALVNYLLDHSRTHGGSLLLSGVDIFVTGILIFAVLFWELDRGGPDVRNTPRAGRPDFFFQEMDAATNMAGWRPAFVDYLYLSFTNCTAFSPTDTMPLSARAKLLMLVEAAGSLSTAAVVLARAVSLLGT
jgi:uncharacterized membrane protein